MTTVCKHCGAQLALGAIACFRCGRLVDSELTNGGQSAVGKAPTQLGTVAQAELLEGQWRLMKLIGRGAVAEVWRAQDVTLDRPVAVKWMHAHLAQDLFALARFEREARLLAGVEHANLITVLGIGKAKDRPFLVTWLLEGKTLAELLHQRGGRLSPVEAARLLGPVCEALDALHRAKLVHRDLKPSNVFIGDDGKVTVTDLGSVYEGGSDLTRAGELVGTVEYLSPEQLAGTRELTGASDIYALGCLLYEMLTSKPPFEGPPGEVIAAHATAPRPGAPGAPPELAELIRFAMSVSPGERPTALELKARLDAFLQTQPAPPAAVTPSAHRPAPPADVPAPRRSAPPPPVSTAPPVVAAPAPPPSAQSTTAQTAVVLRPVADAPAALSTAVVRPVAKVAPAQARRDKLGYGVAAALLLLIFGLLVMPRRAAEMVVVPPPMPIPGLPVTRPIGANDAPQATPELLAKKDELAERSKQAEKMRAAPRRNARPNLTHKNVPYTVAGSISELQIKTLLDGEQVGALVTVDRDLPKYAPMLLQVTPGTHSIIVERRPWPPSQFNVEILPHKSMRLEVELRPIKDASEE